MKITVKNLKGKNQGELEVKFQLIENGKGTQRARSDQPARRASTPGRRVSGTWDAAA